MAKFCNQCGTPLEDGAAFCSNCGKTLGAPPPPEQAAPPPPPAQEYTPPPPVQQEYTPPPPVQQEYTPPPPVQQEYTPPPVQGYAPPPAQGYAPPPQQGYIPPAPPPPMPKKKFPLWLLLVIIAGAAAAVVVIVLFVPFGVLGNVAEKDYFDIGGDQVPSVKLVIGEQRDVTSSSTSTSNGITTMTIKYKVDENQSGEMEKYANALTGRYGFVATTPTDFSGPAGYDMVFATESAEEGYIVMVQIDYDTKGYTLTITRGQGTLNLLEEDNGPKIGSRGDDEDTEPVQTGDLIEILIPAIFIGIMTDEDVMQVASDGGFEAFSNADGSYTYLLTYDQQAQLLAEFDDMMANSFQNMLDEDLFPGLMLIEWSDNYDTIYLTGAEEFFSDDGSAFAAVVTIGLLAPIYQVYQGKGNAARSEISLFDEIDDRFIASFISPDDISDMFYW